MGVDGQIRCIVSVKANEDNTYEAFAVGDAFLANRLASGLAKLGLSADASFTSLRYVRFMSPNYDLLLSEKDGAWTWVNLLGTLEANAQILTTRPGWGPVGQRIFNSTEPGYSSWRLNTWGHFV